MGNHMLTSLLAPGIAVYVLTARPVDRSAPRGPSRARSGDPRSGCSVYLYVPIRAAADPAIHYDYAPDPWRCSCATSWPGLLGADGVPEPRGHRPGACELGTFAGQLGDALTPPVAIGLGPARGRGPGSPAPRVGRTGRRGCSRHRRADAVRTADLCNGDLERYQLFPVAVMAALRRRGAPRCGRPPRSGQRAGGPVAPGAVRRGARSPAGCCRPCCSCPDRPGHDQRRTGSRSRERGVSSRTGRQVAPERRCRVLVEHGHPAVVHAGRRGSTAGPDGGQRRVHRRRRDRALARRGVDRW